MNSYLFWPKDKTEKILQTFHTIAVSLSSVITGGLCHARVPVDVLIITRLQLQTFCLTHTICTQNTQVVLNTLDIDTVTASKACRIFLLKHAEYLIFTGDLIENCTCASSLGKCVTEKGPDGCIHCRCIVVTVPIHSFSGDDFSGTPKEVGKCYSPLFDGLFWVWHILATDCHHFCPVQ